jgi:hypothetical protein
MRSQLHHILLSAKKTALDQQNIQSLQDDIKKYFTIEMIRELNENPKDFLYFFLDLSINFSQSLKLFNDYKDLNFNLEGTGNHNILTLLLTQSSKDKQEFDNIKDSIDFFYNKGVDVSKKDLSINPNKNTSDQANVLFLLPEGVHYYDFYRNIIERGQVDINHKNESGHTPIINASLCDKECVLFLLELGADPYIKNIFNQDAFEASKIWNKEIYDILIVYEQKKELEKASVKEKTINIKPKLL